MRTILAAIVVFGTVGQAAAQTAVTVRPRGQDLTVDNGFVGPYGPGLPGVSMFRNRALPITPDFYDGGVKVPTSQRVENEQIYSQSELPYLDGWHGTLGEGFPF